MGIFGPKKEKPRPDFSNVQRGGSSTAAPAPAPPTSQPDLAPISGETYVVVEGDSLSKIAQKKYGKASKWRRIFEANRDIIKDPDLIYPGQELRIPAAETA
jgi:nucleoid-associated protein YgaU